MKCEELFLRKTVSKHELRDLISPEEYTGLLLNTHSVSEYSPQLMIPRYNDPH